MESHLVLMLDYRWNFEIYTLMVLMMEIFRSYFLEVLWDKLILKCLALMKASKWDLLMEKYLELYFAMYMEPQ